jgi:hypothetical protein
MPTPTIPERDEVLEKFIRDCHISHADFAGDVYVQEFYKACALVAAFSARRAREKAIEECLKILSDAGVNNYRYDSEGHDWKQLFEELEQLKSQPQ